MLVGYILLLYLKRKVGNSLVNKTQGNSSSKIVIGNKLLCVLPFHNNIPKSHETLFKQTLFKAYSEVNPNEESWEDILSIICKKLRYEELRYKFAVQAERPNELYKNLAVDSKV